MNRLHCFFWAMLFSLVTLAQENNHIIKLHDFATFDSENFYFQEVLDLRAFKGNIGFVNPGNSYDIRAANLSAGVKLSLQRALSTANPPNENSVALVLGIKRLFISEHAAYDSELGLCEMEVEILIRKNDRLYSWGNYEATTQQIGLNVTENSAERIEQALRKCIIAFSASNWEQREPVSQLHEELKYKVYFPDSLVTGIYASLEDLKDQKPMNNQEFFLKVYPNNKDPHEFYRAFYQEREEKVRDVFAVVWNNAIYLSIKNDLKGDYLVKAENLGRYLFFEHKRILLSMSKSIGLNMGQQSHFSSFVFDIETGIFFVPSKDMMNRLLIDYPHLYPEYLASDKKLDDLKRIFKAID